MHRYWNSPLQDASLRGLMAIVVTMALSVLTSCVSQAEPPHTLTPRHVRVIWHDDPATSAIVSWTTTEPGTKHLVKLRADGQEDWTSIESERNEQFQGELGGDTVPYAHHTTLTDLQPATEYHVVCQTDDHPSREFYFITAPNDDRPISLLFGGDSRSGIDERQNVNRMMARMVAEQQVAERPPILALAHGGDFIRNGTALDQWLAWLDHHELTTGDDGRLLPIIPARGNHDMGPIFNQVFAFPERDENYYAVSLSSYVRLATLNTETSTAGDQRDWLADELAAERWNHRWYIAQYHKPAFPAVKIPSGALTNWVPLFEQYQVNMACEADGHVIKRTPPLKGTKVDPEGVVYIGEGGLGVGQRTPKTSRWYLQDTAEHCGSDHHLHLLTFRPERFDCRVVTMDGEVFDEFTLAPRTPPQVSAKTPDAASVTN